MGFSRQEFWSGLPFPSPELDVRVGPYKEDWVPKNWCFWTVVLEKTLESPLDCKEIQPVNPKGNQYWIFIGRTDFEAPIFWPPDAKSWLIRKDPDAGKDRRQEEKGSTENEWLDGMSDLMDMSLSKLHKTEDREAWCAAVHGVGKSRIWLSDWTTITGKAMWSSVYSRSVTYNSMCPLGLYSPPDSSVYGMLQAVILEWIATPSSGGSSQPRDRIHISASPALGGGFFTIAPPVNRVLRLMQLVTTNLVAWRRHWQPTPALLPGKSHGQRSLVGYGPWGR